MSVDPFIQSPTDSQSVNPYSYIMNNPLAGTDPTGFTSEDAIAKETTEPTRKRYDNCNGMLGSRRSCTDRETGALLVVSGQENNAKGSSNSDKGDVGKNSGASGGLSSDQLSQLYSDTASTIGNGAAAAVGNLIPDMVNGIADWTEQFLHQDSGSLGRMDQWVDVDNEIAQEVANDFRKIAAVGTAMVPVIRTSTSTSLIRQLDQQGIKHTPANIVLIGKNADGKIIFLETGKADAGLQHIIQRHEVDFANRGISQAQIPQAVMAAVTRGRVVGYQGKGTGRPIYEVGFGGQTHRIAVTTSRNGFIVGANPAR